MQLVICLIGLVLLSLWVGWLIGSAQGDRALRRERAAKEFWRDSWYGEDLLRPVARILAEEHETNEERT